MRKAFNNPKFCTAVNEKGFQMIKTPNGEIIPGVIKSVIVDEVDNVPVATVTLYVNIDGYTEE